MSVHEESNCMPPLLVYCLTCDECGESCRGSNESHIFLLEDGRSVCKSCNDRILSEQAAAK